MKKIIILLFIITFALLCLPLSAHPGRTDANGGHYNRSTGEYHYHHGYSAHSHYDMDSDGEIDCPYDFDDKTNHKSSTATTSANDATNEPSTNPGIIAGIVAASIITISGAGLYFVTK
ncbi:MAG: YHYH domain-containing protein [Clostridia bacterium]|nr:YHYH domain-containing protein [Clostridia bacterium]